jgi:hypothetical protein
MARDVYEGIVAVRNDDGLLPLSGVEITVRIKGEAVPAVIYQNSSGASQGPTPASGGTNGPNPFTTGPSGAIEFWCESPEVYEIDIHDIQAPPRIADRTFGWNAMASEEGSLPAAVIIDNSIEAIKLANGAVTKNAIDQSAVLGHHLGMGVFTHYVPNEVSGVSQEIAILPSDPTWDSGHWVTVLDADFTTYVANQRVAMWADFSIFLVPITNDSDCLGLIRHRIDGGVLEDGSHAGARHHAIGLQMPVGQNNNMINHRWAWHRVKTIPSAGAHTFDVQVARAGSSQVGLIIIRGDRAATVMLLGAAATEGL